MKHTCGSCVPVIHMMGAGLAGGRIANSSGVFFWVWTLIALGVTAIFSVILSARGLRSGDSSDRRTTQSGKFSSTHGADNEEPAH
jgi:hypothetical protein